LRGAIAADSDRKLNPLRLGALERARFILGVVEEAANRLSDPTVPDGAVGVDLAW
jgi:hypothetical protein